MSAGSTDIVLCDTTFFSVVGQITARPDLVAHWPSDVVEEVNASILAVSVISIAEVRAGYLHARWGADRRAREERRLQAMLRIPLDNRVVDTWAEMRAAGLARGRTFHDNDLWIASTAHARGLPVVTCDRGFLAMQDLGVRVIYLPRSPESSAG